MTAPRLARGGKGRILVYFVSVIVVIGLMAIVHNAQQELDDVRKSGTRCQQQQESLSAQMQVIIEYKARLEKSLKTERAEHLLTKNELQTKVQEEKARQDKISIEEGLRLASLQQHYKLLQSQHDDLAEECSSTKQQQMSEINSLKAQLQETGGQLQKAQSDKDKSLEHWKSKYIQLLADKDILKDKLDRNNMEKTDTSENEKKLKTVIYHLQKKLDLYASKCKTVNLYAYENPTAATNVDKYNSEEQISNIKEFTNQVHIKKDVYEIRTKDNKPSTFKKQIINSVENFQIYPKQFQENKQAQPVDKNDQKSVNENRNVLQQPNIEKKNLTSTTPKTIVKVENRGNNKSLKSLVVPTLPQNDGDKYEHWMMSNLGNGENPIQQIDTLEQFAENNVNNKKQASLGEIKKPVPAGVLPIPDNELSQIAQPDDIKNFADLERQNKNTLDSELNQEHNLNDKQNIKKPNKHNEAQKISLQHETSNELENGAHEIMDAPNVGNIELNEDNIGDNRAQDTLNNGNIEDNFNMIDDEKQIPNNAQEDTFDNKPLVLNKNRLIVKPNVKNKIKSKISDNLMNEKNVVRGPGAYPDRGIEGNPEYPDDQQEDLQLDPQMEDEDDDPDEYESHLIARNKDPAVRNK